MTERLYYSDAYLREFDAAVIDQADAGQRIYLDRTAFYPTSGGQPFDTGRLGGVEVIDVVDEGDRIAHLMAGPVTNPHPIGQIDWGRRFDHMQQHTGQHLLSAVMAELFGYGTLGVHFGTDVSTIDLKTGALAENQVAMAEERANAVVTENRPVEVTFEAADAALGLRKPSERAGNLRIVSIHDLDRSGCGGTHVRATGEIGAILIRKVERVRNGIRLEFLCGGRAVQRSRADFSTLARLAAQFTSTSEELPRLIESQRQELKEASSGRQELQSALDLCRARALYHATQPDRTGIRRVLVRDTGEPLEGLRGVAQAYASLPKAIFIGAAATPPAVVFATSMDTGIDAAGVLKGLLASVGGRGGGSATLAQGVLPARSHLDTVIASIAG
jgi:alanyl-tRNA synthetase